MRRFPRTPLTKDFPDFTLYIPDEDEVKHHHENAKLVFGEPKKDYGSSDDPVKARPYLVFLDSLKKITDLSVPQGHAIAVDNINDAMITRDGGLVIKRHYFKGEEVRLSPWETRFLIKVMGRYC